jgi:hypothetical protein
VDPQVSLRTPRVDGRQPRYFAFPIPEAPSENVGQHFSGIVAAHTALSLRGQITLIEAAATEAKRLGEQGLRKLQDHQPFETLDSMWRAA